MRLDNQVPRFPKSISEAKMDIKDNWGLKPVKEKFDVNEKQDVPLYKQGSSYNNYKERIVQGVKGVKHEDKMIINKSDYTQRGE